MCYLAHKSDDGRVQTLAEHQAGTSMLCENFAKEFGADDYGRMIGIAHDIGKATPEFQKRLMGGKKVDHASAGALECAKIGEMLAAMCVIGHHSGLPDYGNDQTDRPGDPTCMGRLLKAMNGGIPRYHWEDPLPYPPEMPEFPDNFALSLWVRMLYSCLVDADYLDTEQFMSNGSIQRGGYDSMDVLLDRLEQHISQWFPPKSELNRKRCAILNTCLEAGSSPKGIYTLTVPTGGGKTVSSLAFALRHAVKHGMKRIIYVVPYTSIIEQNAEEFRKILGSHNVIEHHSGATFDSDEEINDRKSLRRLACENWDAPVIVTTAVQFFESLYSNRSSKCRKLHNIAGSVIIFDEAQMLPTNHLRPCVGAIANLTTHFGATAVLCTATQPVLNDLIQSFAPGTSVREICPNTAELYEQFRRVSFRNVGKCSTEALAAQLSAHNQVLCIVNSRKAAQEIYELLPAEGSFHLSTLMYPAHRQSVLRTIRQRLTADLPCRVVSTSLIEAGVDVDFPAVYREMAGLDSILQAAGRCNRNGRHTPQESIVTCFEGEAPAPMLFRTAIGATREVLSGGADPGSPDTVRRYFAAYRSLIGDKLDICRIVEHLQKGISGCALPFKTTAEQFRFIDQATKTVYIPMDQGAYLCEELQGGTATRTTYRKAGQYGVSIYDQHYRNLLQAGDILPLDDDSAILTNLSLYTQETGLSLNADFGKAEFI